MTTRHAFVVGAPDASVYVGGPTQFRNEPLSNPDAPVASPGPKTMFSVPKGQPDTMFDQPAFVIFPNSQPAASGVDCDAMNQFQRGGPPRGGLPTFFRPANRADLTNTGDQGGRIESNKYLLVPPMRYNTVARTPFGPKNVKDTGSTYSKGVRSRIPALSLGG